MQVQARGTSFPRDRRNRATVDERHEAARTLNLAQSAISLCCRNESENKPGRRDAGGFKALLAAERRAGDSETRGGGRGHGADREPEEAAGGRVTGEQRYNGE